MTSRLEEIMDNFRISRNLPAAAAYQVAFVDSKGKLPGGANKDVLHFKKDELPVEAFWPFEMGVPGGEKSELNLEGG